MNHIIIVNHDVKHGFTMYHLQVFDGFLELQLGLAINVALPQRHGARTGAPGSRFWVLVRNPHSIWKSGRIMDHWIIPNVIQNWKRIMKSPSRVVKHWQTQLANFICVSNGINQPAALQSVLKYLTILQGSRPH